MTLCVLTFKGSCDSSQNFTSCCSTRPPWDPLHRTLKQQEVCLRTTEKVFCFLWYGELWPTEIKTSCQWMHFLALGAYTETRHNACMDIFQSWKRYKIIQFQLSASPSSWESSSSFSITVLAENYHTMQWISNSWVPGTVMFAANMPIGDTGLSSSIPWMCLKTTIPKLHSFPTKASRAIPVGNLTVLNRGRHTRHMPP